VQRDRPGHAVHGKIAGNVATLRSGLFHAAALERHLRKFFHVEEFRAAQVIVPLFDSCVDAAQVDLRRNRGILGMLAIDFDLAAELREFSVGGAQELVHRETNHRTRRIEFVCLVC